MLIQSQCSNNHRIRKERQYIVTWQSYQGSEAAAKNILPQHGGTCLVVVDDLHAGAKDGGDGLVVGEEQLHVRAVALLHDALLAPLAPQHAVAPGRRAR